MFRRVGRRFAKGIRRVLARQGTITTPRRKGTIAIIVALALALPGAPVFAIPAVDSRPSGGAHDSPVALTPDSLAILLRDVADCDSAQQGMLGCHRLGGLATKGRVDATGVRWISIGISGPWNDAQRGRIYQAIHEWNIHVPDTKLGFVTNAHWGNDIEFVDRDPSKQTCGEYFPSDDRIELHPVLMAEESTNGGALVWVMAHEVGHFLGVTHPASAPGGNSVMTYPPNYDCTQANVQSWGMNLPGPEDVASVANCIQQAENMGNTFPDIYEGEVEEYAYEEPLQVCYDYWWVTTYWRKGSQGWYISGQDRQYLGTVCYEQEG